MTARLRSTITVLIAAIAVGVPASAQQDTSSTQGKTFTAPDGTFRFAFSNDFQLCPPGKYDTCAQSFIPVCGQDALACVVFGSNKFKGTNFEAASFQVREVRREQETMTPDVCVTPYPQHDAAGVEPWPEFMISAKQPEEVIGGIRFVHGIKGGVATSHSNSVDLYRTFYKKKCFELSLTETETDPAISDPPMKTLTPIQAKSFEKSMSDLLHSFRFLK